MTRTGLRGSLRFDPKFLDDRPPFLGIGLHQRPEHNVPVVYSESAFARDGGLLSYGSDPIDNFRRAANYGDRILRGAKPGDLPVQFPVKYELVINLKTAKALGLTIPETMLATADAVIQ